MPARPARGRELLAVASVTGVCIVILAFFSRRVFREPISDVYLAVPPLMMAVHQMALKKAGDAWIWRTSTWVGAIVLATARHSRAGMELRAPALR